MDKDNKLREQVKQQFTDYLTTNEHRRTAERYAILDMIYSDPRHFDSETLLAEMNERSLRVSRATVYNTLQLLVECGLVRKHQFGRNLSFYERSLGNEIHHHLVCTECNAVREYRDMRIRTLIQNKNIKNFTLSHYSLTIYGVCNVCARKLKQANKQKQLRK